MRAKETKEIIDEMKLHTSRLSALSEIYDSILEKEIPDEVDLRNQKAKARQVKLKAEKITFYIEKSLSEMRFKLNV